MKKLNFIIKSLRRKYYKKLLIFFQGTCIQFHYENKRFQLIPIPIPIKRRTPFFNTLYFHTSLTHVIIYRCKYQFNWLLTFNYFCDGKKCLFNRKFILIVFLLFNVINRCPTAVL